MPASGLARSGKEGLVMTAVERLEREIAGLSTVDLAALRAWFAIFDAETWDRQFEHDVEAGRLDALAEAALAEHQAGGTRAL
jgi:hypothetical protein